MDGHVNTFDISGTCISHSQNKRSMWVYVSFSNINLKFPNSSLIGMCLQFIIRQKIAWTIEASNIVDSKKDTKLMDPP